MNSLKQALAVLASTFLLGASAGAATTTMLSPLTTFGQYGDGSVRPGDGFPPWPPVTVGTSTTGYQRGYAYDPTTGNTVLTDPNTGSTANPNFLGGVYVIDGNTGQVVGTLNTNGIVGGTYSAGALVVADDGVVYMCNQVNSGSTQGFMIYSWTNVWQSNSAPYLAFSNTIPANQRYGANMDIRGAGLNTQIIIGSKSQGGSSGTNVVIFTTADGVNFTATPLATDATAADFADGIAFGTGNTFWAKTSLANGAGHPLRLMSFNLATSNAVTLAQFGTNSLAGADGLGPLAVDTAHSLLAAIEVRSATAGPQRVWLLDIAPTLADNTKVPVLLDVHSFSSQNPFASGPNGYVDFGGGKLYSHAINNGLLSFTTNSVTMPLPTLVSTLAPTNRVAETTTVHFEMIAYPNCSYQWQKNGTNIPGATLGAYNLPLAAVSDSGQYSVIVSNAAGAVTSTTNQLLVVGMSHLNTLWSANPNDALNYPYVTTTGGSSTPNERTIAYNALSNQVYVVQRVGGVLKIWVVDALTGTALYNLNTTGITGGSIVLIGIAVADDGSIYACNETQNGSTTAWKLYRWADSNPSTVPVNVFTGDPAAVFTSGLHVRWGDTLAVRGSGATTQVIIDDTQDGSTTTSPYVALFLPTDQYCTNFTDKMVVLDGTYPISPIGRSIQWAPGNSFWQKREGSNKPLFLTTIDPNGASTQFPLSFTAYANTWPNTLGACAVDTTRNLLAGVNFSGTAGSSPDSVSLYDVSDPNAPISFLSYAFPINKVANANFIGQVILTSNYLFAIDGNNGMVAFTVESGPPNPPNFLTQPQSLRLVQGGNGALTVSVDLSSKFQWQKAPANLPSAFTNVPAATTATYTINNAPFSAAGYYRCIATNLYGASTSDVASVTVTAPGDLYSLAQVWSVSPISDSAPPYVSTNNSNTPFERSLAYNALSNQLVVVQAGPSSPDFAVYVVDAATGTLLYTLNTNGVVHQGTSEVSGSNPLDLCSVAVADDGAIYIGNLSPNASGGSLSDPTKMFRLYRWADSNPNTAPTSVFAGDPANQTSNLRWGDSLVVRGSGIGTQVLLDNNQGTYGAVLVPMDASLTAFTNAGFAQAYGSGSIGRSLQFGPTNSFWQKRKGRPLRFSTADVTNQVSTILAAYNQFPLTLAGLTVDTSRNLAAGVDFIGNTNAPDVVDLYEISDLTTPLLIAQYSFPTNQQGNANFIAQTLIVGDKVFAIDGNNGIVAFNVVTPGLPVLSATLSGGNVLLSWGSSFTGFTLYSSTAVAGPYTTPEGAGTVVGSSYWVTNSASGGAKFYRLQK